MSYNDKKITNAEIQQNYVKSAPDVLTGSTRENKDVFDKLIELFIARYNGLIDELAVNGMTGVSPITIENYTISHDNSGVTAGQYGSSTTQTPDDNGTFIVPYVITDAKGHIVTAGESTVRLPKTNYVHTQSTASAVWTIQHNLSKYPSVTVIDSSGAEVFGNIEYVDVDNITLSFNVAITGKAYLN